MSEDGTQGSERRIYDRVPLVLKVEYDSRDGFLRDYTTNISRGGTMLRTTRDLDEGTDVHLVLSFPGLLRKIALAGVVRWVRLEEGGERAVGVEFAEESAGATRELSKLVERIEAGDESVVTSSTLRVLVVEDNPHVAELIRRGLDAHVARMGGGVGFDVSDVSDGLQALQALEEGGYDVLITDIFLPGLDGEEVIRRLRSQRRFDELPIIAFSAGGSDVRVRVLQAGADFFLAKPLRLADLLATMRRLFAAADRR